MALPTFTPEQRAENLAKGARVRTERAELKRLLKQGSTTIAAVLEDARSNDVIAKMKVLALVQAMPGVGKVRAAQIMERLQIAENRKVRGLGANQRQALEAEFVPV